MVNYSQWLGEVNDDVLISSLSIPGTHNSAASHTALPSVQCQGKDVGEQLKNGVRFFDIRVSKNVLKSDENEQKDLIVIHGKFPVKLLGNVYLKDVLSDVYKFLEQNRSETVIVSIKQEGNGEWDNDNDEFGNLIWDKYINPNKDRWYLNTQIPRIGEARGKAIIFRRFGVKNEDRKREFGIDAAWWTYNTTNDDRGTIQVQDWCELSSAEDISKKAQYIKDLSKRAVEHNSTNSNDPKLFINFCSGSNFFDPNCWPSKIAEGLNQNKIEEAFGKGNGVIILDYAESNNWKLVKELVEKNF
ncbi:1-phosphatidylinositol phosphodiesterase [Wickerhamomyces ciferrii]|uniref:1-phosphatidylinositol phosphodiesterase n=1 Tax=Wickerhamomyces ciferrii (strain ATCC 14091 / BCRC 22168 / CBS 111 / JCM 3599 / NBRC 0793 / NRRL Y-1031 F-60-10) TaxID=1206466 RepID=K0KTW6_WICCF|nr:1-phosphatidylinositol phosphodiesterase [Wickerhamomyces ciferrii]CCH44829.1 1-phosphatidylinositol phosphodiesterase [Wickerhamomyces ciferrii]